MQGHRAATQNRLPRLARPHNTRTSNYLRYDARSQFFVTLTTILVNTRYGYLFMRDQMTDMRDQMTDPIWWDHHFSGAQITVVTRDLREFALMPKFFAVMGAAMAAESTARSIVRSAPSGLFKTKPTNGIARIHGEVLSVAGCRRYRPLSDIVRYVRNTIHNNGIVTDKTRTLQFWRRRFSFVQHRRLKWLGEEEMVWLLTQLREAMLEIVTSRAVSQIPHCPRCV